MLTDATSTVRLQHEELGHRPVRALYGRPFIHEREASQLPVHVHEVGTPSMLLPVSAQVGVTEGAALVGHTAVVAAQLIEVEL